MHTVSNCNTIAVRDVKAPAPMQNVPNLPKYSVYHVSGAHSEQQSIYWGVESSPEMSKHGFEEVHIPWFPPYWATHKSIHKYLCFEHISFKNYG